MKLLAIGRPRPGIDARTSIAPHARDEVAALWQMYRSGLVREIYSPGGPGIVMVLEASSPEEAKAALDGLPLVANDIVEIELIPLQPFTALTVLFEGR
jgi:hypothetical protein